MSSINRTNNLVAKAQDELLRSHASEEPTAQLRHERNARIYADLATAQALRDQNLERRTANIIAMLNSDRLTWSVADENVVRAALDLPLLPKASDTQGGDVDDLPL